MSSPRSKLSRCILPISLYSSVKNILKVQPSFDNLGCLHGMRLFTINWVVHAHSYMYSLGFLSNLLDYKDYLTHWSYDVINNAHLPPDTFFTLSGILLGYTTIKKMQRVGTWKIKWGRFYVHRYMRLTPPYMLVILITLGLMRFTGSGAT